MGILSDTVKGTANDVKDAVGGIVSEQNRRDYPAPDPKTPGTEHAVGQMQHYNDASSAASLSGMHPMEQHFAPSSVRHPLGRGIPKSHPALQ